MGRKERKKKGVVVDKISGSTPFPNYWWRLPFVTTAMQTQKWDVHFQSDVGSPKPPTFPWPNSNQILFPHFFRRIVLPFYTSRCGGVGGSCDSRPRDFWKFSVLGWRLCGIGGLRGSHRAQSRSHYCSKLHWIGLGRSGSARLLIIFVRTRTQPVAYETASHVSILSGKTNSFWPSWIVFSPMIIKTKIKFSKAQSKTSNSIPLKFTT